MDFDEEEDLYFLNLMMVVTMIGVVLIKKKQNSIRRTRRPYQAIYLQRNLVGAHQRLLENNLVSYMEFVRMDFNFSEIGLNQTSSAYNHILSM